MPKRRFVKSFFLLAIVSCATAPPPEMESYKSSRNFPYSFEQTWKAVVEALSEAAWPIEKQDKTSGAISTGYVTWGEAVHYVDCPAGEHQDITQFRGKLSVSVRPALENETMVKIDAYLDGWDSDPTGEGWWVTCSSTGELEREIFAKISSILE